VNLNLIDTFVRVAQTRSFTLAARSLGLPTSSVSRGIRRLEKELGARLFERTTRSTALTAVGRAYFEHACRGLAELADGERVVGELQGDARGEVRLTAPTHLDDGFLASQLAAFGRAHPRVCVHVVLTNRKVDLISEGFDLALRGEQQLADSSLLVRRLGAFQAWLVASPRYLGRRGVPKAPEDLARHDCVMLSLRGGGQARWQLLGPRGAETVDVRGAFTTDDMAFAKQLVFAGAGVGLLPLAPGAPVPRKSLAVRVLPRYVVRAPELYVVQPSARRPPLRVTLLRDFLVAAYARLPRVEED
jgi:DNA-binding transcriptional LysR family regulator